MPMTNHCVLFLFLCLASLLSTSELLAQAMPQVHDANYELQLMAEQPNIVTPVGMAFDPAGNLFVIESHTHKRGDDYTGPKGDRIRVFSDSNNDGKLDRWHTFFEGTKFTMSLAFAADGSVYVATRMRIFRLTDTDGDLVADKEEPIVHLETKGDYPHNGLAGLVFNENGRLYFGLGENLGLPYKIVAADGSSLAGGGEGGSIYHCSPDGKDLKQIATGVWNPFGMCFDPQQRLFMVDNDPDGRPPCRLLHIVKGGDYGYQFRYGRSGAHPLQAWEGELPGTLSMAAGTGEAPCSVIFHQEELLVTSWGDHRIERYQLHSAGATVKATMQPLVTGDEMFRPVGMAIAADGAIWFSDWVDKSYPVHGQGRIWRLVPKQKSKDIATGLPLSPAELRSQKLQENPTTAALADNDPFVRQAAVWGYAQAVPQLKSLAWMKQNDALTRLGILQAHRWIGTKITDLNPENMLADRDDRVQLHAIRWIADEGRTEYTETLRTKIKEGKVSSKTLAAYVSAVSWLETGVTGNKQDWLDQKILVDLVNDKQASPEVRALALKLLPVNQPGLSTKTLLQWIGGSSGILRFEAVRTLAQRTDPLANNAIQHIVQDKNYPASIRAEAILGLAGDVVKNNALLRKLSQDKEVVVRTEALRTVRKPDSIVRKSSPNITNTDAWLTLFQGTADTEAGRRTFYSKRGGNCAACHTVDGRGAKIGPDLTHIGQTSTKAKLLESILQPSKEIAPMFVPWILQLESGVTKTGFPLNKITDKGEEQFADAEGKVFTLDPVAIELRKASTQSIMPHGLEKILTDEELRDLIAYLMSQH